LAAKVMLFFKIFKKDLKKSWRKKQSISQNYQFIV